MKKKLMYIIVCVTIVLGLTNNNTLYFNRYTEEIKNIKYNDLVLIKEDYQTINDILENIKFNNTKIIELDALHSIISITTVENDIHEFYIYHNNIIKYKTNNDTFYANHNNDTLIKLYDAIKSKYGNIANE